MFSKFMKDWIGYAVVFGGTAIGLLTAYEVFIFGSVTYSEPNKIIISLELALFLYGIMWIMSKVRMFGRSAK